MGWALEGVAAGRRRCRSGLNRIPWTLLLPPAAPLPGLYLARGCQMSEALEICQSDFLRPEKEPEGQRGEGAASGHGA